MFGGARVGTFLLLSLGSAALTGLHGLRRVAASTLGAAVTGKPRCLPLLRLGKAPYLRALARGPFVSFERPLTLVGANSPTGNSKGRLPLSAHFFILLAAFCNAFASRMG